MKKIISICIPTRNRVYTLNKNIEHLIKIINYNKLDQIIDIIISDNSSDENYNRIIKINEKFLKIFRSEDNGHDENIRQLILNSNSDFIWLCQDHTKIIEEPLLEIIKLLIKNKKNIDYLFLSTKNNFRPEKIYLVEPKLFSTRNIYLNTNLVKLEPFKQHYLNLFDMYNGSHLVFHFSILNLLFSKKQTYASYKLEQCSIYKYFNTDNEHFKMTWSNSLYNYLNILNNSSKFYNYFLIKNKSNSKINIKLFKSFKKSIPTMYRIFQLYRNSNKEITISNDFINHPTFNFYEKTILNLLFNYKLKLLSFVIPKIIIIDIYYLIFLPNEYFSRLIRKLFKRF